MQTVWAIIVGAIILLIVYGIVSSKLTNRRKRLVREKALPYLSETIRPGIKYDVTLSDGRTFPRVELLGTSDPADGPSALGGWEGMLVLKTESGKRIFARQAAIRFLVEL